MRADSKVISDRLVELSTSLGLGSFLGTSDWSFYRNHLPSSPARAISIADAPGLPDEVSMDTTHPVLVTAVVQIRVRGLSRDEVGEKMRTILTTLRTTTHVAETIGDDYVLYQTVRPGAASFSSAGAEGTHEQSANIELVKSIKKVTS